MGFREREQCSLRVTEAQFHFQVKGLTVDANGTAVGILNNSAEEGSRVEDVNIFNRIERRPSDPGSHSKPNAGA